MSLTRTAAKYGTKLHTVIYRLTKGKLGGRIGSGETVLVMTTGRRSGKERTTPLIGVPDGDRIVLIASAGGADEDPDWFKNLVAHPDVTVERKGQRSVMTASVVEGDERDRLWTAAAALYKGYDRYTQKTSRPIPVVVLAPSR